MEDDEDAEDARVVFAMVEQVGPRALYNPLYILRFTYCVLHIAFYILRFTRTPRPDRSRCRAPRRRLTRAPREQVAAKLDARIKRVTEEGARRKPSAGESPRSGDSAPPDRPVQKLTRLESSYEVCFPARRPLEFGG